MSEISAPPAFPQLGEWSQIQAAYASRALQYCPNFPELAARHEAWWHYANPGPPLVLASAGMDLSVPGGRLLHLLNQPELWMETRLAQLKQTHYIGDTLPSIRVDYGPVCLGMLLGAPVEFSSDTTWTHAFIYDDWSNAPDWQLDEDNPWWHLLSRLLRLNAESALGCYLPMAPSLGGSADLLLNLRGAAALALDIVDQPARITAALEKIYQAWRKGFELIWGTTLGAGAGMVNWVNLWSNQPYHVLECDFNYMIGPQAFHNLLLPEIVRQAQSVGRSIFHLDGPGAARHYRALLDTPEINAIQYVTGAGHSALTHLDMLKEIQRRGRPLQVTVPAHEAVELSQLLQPEGLCLIVEGGLDAAGLDALYREICRPF